MTEIIQPGSSGINTKTTKLEPIKNLEDWRSLGFGLFIHWGVYAVLAGTYSGNDVTGANVTYDCLADGTASEWILRNARIPQATYKANQSGFTADNWNPEEIVRMAYNAGMKYIILTAKHHEGFCLFQSSNAEWNISTSGASGKELITPLKSACQKYGLKFGLYFSQHYDWTATGGFGQKFISLDNTTDPYTSQQHAVYVSKTILLINDLMSKYSPDILWYDIPGADSDMQPIKNNELITYPNVVVNDRLSTKNIGDYATGEGGYYQGTRKYAEDCYAFNGTWGYATAYDTSAKTKSVEWIFKKFILESLARGHNALLNIGPKADGSVPDLQKAVLSQIGDFCKKYGTLFNSRNVNSQCQPQWGRMIAKGNTLMCYVYRGAGTTIQVHGIHTRFVKSVRVFDAADEYAASNYTVISDTVIQITNLVYDALTGLAVISIDFSNNIVSDDINYVTQNDSITCLTFNINGSAFVQNDGSAFSIGGWTDDADYLDTVFQFTGSTGNYKIKYTYTTRQTDATQKVTTLFTSLSDNTTQSVTIDRSINTDDTSTIAATMTNGKYYKLKISKTNGWINFTGIQFV